MQSSLTPEVKARGMTLLGDLLASQPQPDFEQAVKYHMLAIKVADPLGVHKKVRVRREAKQVLLDAHLAVANDIARGQWKNQQKVVPQWIQRADLLVKDLAHKGRCQRRGAAQATAFGTRRVCGGRRSHRPFGLGGRSRGRWPEFDRTSNRPDRAAAAFNGNSASHCWMA